MGYQILIVVDDPFLCQRYAEALETTVPPDGGAYHVVSVSTMTNAVWYVARQRFDLILIEGHLRGSLDALTQLLVDRNPRAHVISVGVRAPKPHATPQRLSLPVVAPDCTATELRAIVRLLLSSPPLAVRL
jgi:CheY-like chemotaxis protein